MKLAGWASTPDQDYAGHVIAAGAFGESIARRGITGPRGIKLEIGHDRYKPAGVITKLDQRNRGLWIEAHLDEGISYAKDMAQAIRTNGGFSFSVGFYVLDADIATDSRGRDYLLITKGELLEVSVVVEPMNSEAIMVEFSDDA